MFHFAFFASPATAVFFVSAVLLACGLVAKIWKEAVNLSHLSHSDLQSIEKKHPYLPSLKIISVITLCTGMLLIVAFVLSRMWEPLKGESGWVYFAAPLVLIGTISILMEMRWKPGKTALFITLATVGIFIALHLMNIRS